MKKFNVMAFSFACGLTWGVYVFLIALIAMWWGIGSKIIEIIGNFYIGVDASVGGAFLGLGWAFIDGFIGGLIFAFLYNYFAPKFK